MGPRQGMGRRLRRGWHDYALPLVISLGLHAALGGAVVLAAGWVRPAPAPRARADLTLMLEDPPALANTPRREPAAAAPVAAGDALATLPSVPMPAAVEPDRVSAAPTALAERPPGGGVLSDLSNVRGPSLSAVFAGVGAQQAQSVVYVVDGSGAMVTSLQWVVDDLVRSIDRLSPVQRFAVVIFRNRPPLGDEGAALCDIFNPRGGTPTLLPATGANKRAVRAWLASISPRGLSNPSEGLRRGLEFRPDIVFLLARSIPRSGESPQWEKGRDAILAELERLNPADAAGRRPVQIKTIQFIEEDPTGTMQAIGRLHGGESGYTLVTLDQVEGR